MWPRWGRPLARLSAQPPDPASRWLTFGREGRACPLDRGSSHREAWSAAGRHYGRRATQGIAFPMHAHDNCAERSGEKGLGRGEPLGRLWRICMRRRTVDGLKQSKASELLAHPGGAGGPRVGTSRRSLGRPVGSISLSPDLRTAAGPA